MSKRASFLRYFLIIERLRRQRLTFAEIEAMLELESEIQGYDLQVSKRTFQRDIQDIASLFNIEIACDNYNQYFIQHEEQDSFSHRMLEAFDVFNTLSQAKNLAPFILTEKRRPQGTEHLNKLLQAIRNKVEVSFAYQKHWEDEPSQRRTAPLALKEFKGRWYLLARDAKDKVIKTFGLDRMADPELSQTPYKLDQQYDLEGLFEHAFGITNPYAQEPEEVILSFDPVQGNYIRSYPLHPSQEILVSSDEEFRIRLLLHLTHDFTMELLSYGNRIKVISPASLQEELKESYQKAQAQYR